MKNAKKVLLLLLCAVLLMGTTIFATMAYLTDTETVTNTFTAGSVGITLDEADVKPDGTYESDATVRVYENTYHLLPGHTYIKDPTVHISKDSEACYVFVKVVDEISSIEDATTVEAQMTANGWAKLDGEENVWYYEKVVTPGTTADTAFSGDTDGVDLLVFESFKITGDADVVAFNGLTITVQAYAVQADNFGTAKAAWDAAPANWG